MLEITLKDLLEAGVHFGHQTRRWNPKMKKFIFTERNDIYIIDLKKTFTQLEKAVNVVRNVVSNGGTVLFVGTKPQAQGIIRDAAEKSGQYYVINRWLGGMLTNYRTIRQSVKRLEHFERMATDGTYELLTKKEALTTEKQKQKLLDMLGGIREMTRLPGLLVVVDTRRENIAIREANRLNIPVCAIVDTNSDPDVIDYPIPGNDDAIRSIRILVDQISNAVIEGLQVRQDKETLAAGEVADGDTALMTENMDETEEEKEIRLGRRAPRRAPRKKSDEEEERAVKKESRKASRAPREQVKAKSDAAPETPAKQAAEARKPQKPATPKNTPTPKAPAPKAEQKKPAEEAS